MAKCLMVQGTSSGVGKSLVVAGLCRIFWRAGYRVAPFKAQNMALNSGVTPDGKEMGRAQILQARAAGVPPQVEMNPILLKPTGHSSSQVVVMGRPVANLGAVTYHTEYTEKLFPVVEEAFRRLAGQYDVVIIEGAGSPAEINLKEREIANMRVAKMVGAPVLLVADIDRGGALAAVVGTLELLDPDERDLVVGIVINKFRGDLALLEPGLRLLAERTGKPVLGVIPYLGGLALPEEDSVALEGKAARPSCADELEIAVILTPRVANFSDLDALAAEPGVNLRYVKGREPLGRPDLVILPGSKNTLADLLFLRQTGRAAEIKKLAAQGVPVIGICGGFQMLGREIHDPEQAEAEIESAEGLGLLDIVTTFSREKITYQAEGVIEGPGPLLSPCRGQIVRGYEIHMGRSMRLPGVPPALRIFRRGEERVEVLDGAVSADGLVFGTYLHGLLDNDAFRSQLLNTLRQRKGLADQPAAVSYEDLVEKELDRLAAAVAGGLDLARLAAIMGLERAPVWPAVARGGETCAG